MVMNVKQSTPFFGDFEEIEVEISEIEVEINVICEFLFVNFGFFKFEDRMIWGWMKERGEMGIN